MLSFLRLSSSTFYFPFSHISIGSPIPQDIVVSTEVTKDP
jgi:hypothetical protein